MCWLHVPPVYQWWDNSISYSVHVHVLTQIQAALASISQYQHAHVLQNKQVTEVFTQCTQGVLTIYFQKLNSQQAKHASWPVLNIQTITSADCSNTTCTCTCTVYLSINKPCYDMSVIQCLVFRNCLHKYLNEPKGWNINSFVLRRVQVQQCIIEQPVNKLLTHRSALRIINFSELLHIQYMYIYNSLCVLSVVCIVEWASPPVWLQGALVAARGETRRAVRYTVWCSILMTLAVMTGTAALVGVFMISLWMHSLSKS